MVSERKPPIMSVNPGQPPGNKRHKPDGMPPDGMPPGHGPMPYPQQGYGPPGYMGWQGQYRHGPPPPHAWQGAPGQPMYPPRGGPPMTPDRPGNWSGYRSPQPPPPPPNGKELTRGGRGPIKPNAKSPKAGDAGPMPPHQYGAASGGWNPQWGPQWGNHPPPPPGQWHGGHPPPPQIQHYQGGWTGASQTPPRRPRASPEMMNRGMMGPASYPPSGTPVCAPVGMDVPPPPESDMYVSSRMHDDDCASSTGGKHSDKDKGRGSYKCGRCGVPKKGHVCPYQPKVKRRSGEAAPEMKSAAIQVEMDEFMTLRRLNIRIQGFPESYATDPAMADMVVGEVRPMSAASTLGRPGMMAAHEGPMMEAPDAPRSSPHPGGPPPLMSEPTQV